MRLFNFKGAGEMNSDTRRFIRVGKTRRIPVLNSFRIFGCMLLIVSIIAAVTRNAIAIEKKTVMVQMPDGVRLATDLYIPAGGKKVPVVLIRTPYGREGIANMMLPLLKDNNIALAVQDTRGRFGSEGVSSTFIDDSHDGYETVEWLAAQPWCNGKVGTAGISALGITQYMMLKNTPPHLTCQHVMAAPPSLYPIAYQGGGVRRGLFYGWILGNKFPLHIMHLVLSQIDYSDIWRAIDLSVDYDKVNVPIMHMSGWYDLYLAGTLDAFVNIQGKGGTGARGKQRLVIGPWTHGGFLGLKGTKQGALNYPANSKYDIFKIVDWFQECLNGQDKGFMNGPVVRYYVMGDTDDPKAPGNEWRKADSWPIPATITPYYFHRDGSLSTLKPESADSAVAFVDDPANPVPTLGSRKHEYEREPVDLRPIEERSDVVIFTTPVLEKPIEVTGTIKAKIYFIADVVDTDFVVRLSDVYPDGRSMLLTDGVARASHRESYRYRVPLVPGELYSLDVELWPTSIVFNKGHRIRIIVSGTNFPRFDFNQHNGMFHDISPGELEKAIETGLEAYTYKPDLAPDAKPAHITLHLSSERPSQILLPVAAEYK